MLAEIINAVLTEERILLRLARGELVEDKNGILRDKEGHYAQENAEHHLSLAAYLSNPYLFNLIEMISIVSNPIKTRMIDNYIDSKQETK